MLTIETLRKQAFILSYLHKLQTKFPIIKWIFASCKRIRVDDL